MAMVQYRDEPKEVNISRRMFAPKKVAELDAWFRAARAVIPSIPNPEETDWFISHQDVGLKWIRFEMHNSVGERCYVVIDREAAGLGT